MWTTIQKILLGTALAGALAWNIAQAAEVRGIDVSQGPTGTRAAIQLDGPSDYRVIRLSAPDRLVLDIPASRVAGSVRPPTPAGVVKSVRTGTPQAGTVRIVFDLEQPVAQLSPRVEQGAAGPLLIVEWPGDGEPGSVPASPAVAGDGTAVAVRAAGVDPAASSAATSRLITEILARNASAAVAPPVSGPPVSGEPGPSTATVAPAETAGGQSAARDSSATAAATAAEPEASEAPAVAPVKSLKDLLRGGSTRPLVIAIDAGHGGQDPGALGLKGQREKDITLAIARELAKQIDATPGLKAYLTRDRDVFIPLNQRARLARQAKADMFVSIHADAAENRSASGSSVYVLSTKGASSQRARWLADKENASDLIGGVRLEKASNTLTSVLLDLTQSGHMRASEEAAAHVLAGLRRVGRNHKSQVERANFAVLRTSDMPAMLVETAFISNPEEERKLADPAHQRALARAVLDGVNTYFTRQPPPGTLYAMRAAGPGDSGAAGGSP